MVSQPERVVRAVLTHRGELLGATEEFAVAGARWHDVRPVADALTGRLGVPVVVLRLLTVAGGADGRGGLVTYHAEALRPPAPAARRYARAPAALRALLAPDPLRAAWATADGVRAALEWAGRALRDAGRTVTGPAEQVKTWNLAALFRLPAAGGPVWLKTLPPFAVCESLVIERYAAVDPGFVPRVVAADPARGRVLLAEVPGADCWGAGEPTVREAVTRLAAAQAALAGRPGIGDGLPDRGPGTLAGRVAALLDGPAGAALTAGEARRAGALAGRLPAAARALAECGLPPVVAHGDFHPGNWRSDGRGTVVLDFADAHLGHPVLDGLRPGAFLPADAGRAAADAWCAAWRARVPGCDPARALRLGAPLARLANAVRYQEFLDGIEATERVYHADDPAAELRAALACDRGPV